MIIGGLKIELSLFTILKFLLPFFLLFLELFFQTSLILSLKFLLNGFIYNSIYKYKMVQSYDKTPRRGRFAHLIL